MQIIADLHLHSKYSRAVSPQMNLEEISRFAKLKGIQLVATGDWTHPLWFREIKSKFKEANPSKYKGFISNWLIFGFSSNLSDDSN